MRRAILVHVIVFVTLTVGSAVYVYHRFSVLQSGLQSATALTSALQRHANQVHLGVAELIESGDLESWKTAALAAREMERVLRAYQEALAFPEATLVSLEGDLRSVAAHVDTMNDAAPAARAREMRIVEGALARFWMGWEGLRDHWRSRTEHIFAGAVVTLVGWWAAAVVLYLGFGLLLGRRAGRFRAERAEAVEGDVRTLSEALHAIEQGTPPPPLPEHPAVRDVAARVVALGRSAAALEIALLEERRACGLGRDIADALEPAEDEGTLLRRVAEVALETAPSHGFQVRLAMKPDGPLQPAFDEVPEPCHPQSVDGCPALRRGEVLRHLPHGGLERCPLLARGEGDIVCAPVHVAGCGVGVAQFFAHALAPGAIQAVPILARALGTRLGIVRLVNAHEAEATTDGLTGLLNRRAMDTELRHLDARAAPYAVLLADLDRFKVINDTHGHETGDRCLVLFAQVLGGVAPDGAFACRYGGEEFALILPGIGAGGAAGLADRLRVRAAEASWRLGVPYTVSIGVASRPEHGGDALSVRAAADRALYGAKHGGRNRVRVARAVGATTSPEPFPPEALALSPEPRALA